MRSKDFDTLLRLTDANGTLLADNDDIDYAAKNLDSQILIVPMQDGFYRVIAESYQARGRGEYQLIIRTYSARHK